MPPGPAKDESMEIIAELDAELRSCMRRLECDGFMMVLWARPKLAGRYTSCGSLLFDEPKQEGAPGKGDSVLPLARLAGILINTAKQWGIPADVFKQAVSKSMDDTEVAFIRTTDYNNDRDLGRDGP